jgi:hypothetical protein
MTRSYFAYGSNIILADMALRCPAARFDGVAVLSGYRYLINADCYATVVPAANRTVYGTLWMLTNACECALDKYEGIAEGLYTKSGIYVRSLEGRNIETLIYIAANTAEGAARPGYQEAVVECALGHRFPAEYVEELRLWLPRMAR